MLKELTKYFHVDLSVFIVSDIFIHLFHHHVDLPESRSFKSRGSPFTTKVKKTCTPHPPHKHRSLESMHFSRFFSFKIQPLNPTKKKSAFPSCSFCFRENFLPCNIQKLGEKDYLAFAFFDLTDQLASSRIKMLLDCIKSVWGTRRIFGDFFIISLKETHAKAGSNCPFRRRHAEIQGGPLATFR